MTRTAISPRLATRTRRIGCDGRHRLGADIYYRTSSRRVASRARAAIESKPNRRLARASRERRAWEIALVDPNTRTGKAHAGHAQDQVQERDARAVHRALRGRRQPGRHLHPDEGAAGRRHADAVRVPAARRVAADRAAKAPWCGRARTIRAGPRSRPAWACGSIGSPTAARACSSESSPRRRSRRRSARHDAADQAAAVHRYADARRAGAGAGRAARQRAAGSPARRDAATTISTRRCPSRCRSTPTPTIPERGVRGGDQGPRARRADRADRRWRRRDGHAGRRARDAPRRPRRRDAADPTTSAAPSACRSALPIATRRAELPSPPDSIGESPRLLDTLAVAAHRSAARGRRRSRPSSGSIHRAVAADRARRRADDGRDRRSRTRRRGRPALRAVAAEPRMPVRRSGRAPRRS